MNAPVYFGVYRVFKNGKRKYVSRSITHCEKLAADIVRDLSAGVIVRPDGSIGHCTPHPHVHEPIAHGERK